MSEVLYCFNGCAAGPLLLLYGAGAVPDFEQACIHPKFKTLAALNPTFSMKSFLSIGSLLLQQFWYNIVI